MIEKETELILAVFQTTSIGNSFGFLVMELGDLPQFR